MFGPIARTNPWFVFVLFLLVVETVQTAWAGDTDSPGVEFMLEECTQGGDGYCIRICSRATTGGPRDMHTCRRAYATFKARQSEPAATGEGGATHQTQSVAVTRGVESAQAVVDKITVMGVPLCGDVVKAGEYLEGQGYSNAAMFAKSLRSVNVYKREGSDNYNFKINYGGPPKRDSIYIMSFHGSFQSGPNLFESEKSGFEQATGNELACNPHSTGPNQTRLECKYPAGEADRSRPGFSYSITHEEGQKAFFVDASAWGYEDCGL